MLATCNHEQIFNTLPLNITIYSLEVCNIHRGAAEVNIIIPRVNKFDIQRKDIEYLLYYIPPPHTHIIIPLLLPHISGKITDLI